MKMYQTIRKAGLYLVLLLPLFFTPFTFFPWLFGKTMIFQIVVEILVVGWFIFWLSRRPSVRSWSILKRLNWIDWSILFFLIILIVSAVAGVNFSNSFWGNQARANGVFTWLHFVIFYFLLIGYFNNNEKYQNQERGISFRRYAVFAILTAVVVCFSAFFQDYLPSSWRGNLGMRLSGIIGNSAFLAAYLIPAGGLAFYLLITAQKKWRYFFSCAAILIFATLILTGIRGAFIGLAIGIFTGLIASLFILSSKKQKVIAILIFAILIILFLILFGLSQGKSFQLNFPRLASLFNFYNYLKDTGATRLMAWEAALKGLMDRPLLGWGWGNYEVIFNKFYNPQFLTFGFKETVWDKPHNWFLEIGSSAGLMGMTGYLMIFVAAFYYLFRQATIRRIEKIILAATFVAYFVQNLFLFETTNALILWFVLLAYVSSLEHRRDQEHLPHPALDELSQGAGKRILFGGVKILVIILFFFSLYKFAYLPLRSSYFMRQAELSATLTEWIKYADKALTIPVPFLSENAIFLGQQFTNFDKANAILVNKETESAALKITGVLEESGKKYNDNLSFPVWAGQVYMVLGERFNNKYYQDAERVLWQAQKIAPQKQEVLFLSGRLYLLKKDFNKAIEVHQRAVELAPQIGISHWFLGLAYVASGDRPAGLKEIEKAQAFGYTLTIDKKMYVWDIYALEKNYAKLIEEYSAALEAEPENVNWYIKLAAAYALAGEKKKALELAKEAMNLYPPLKAEAEKFIKEYKLKE